MSLKNFDLSFCSIAYHNQKLIYFNKKDSLSKKGILNKEYIPYYLEG